jgi:hypothetical protein
MKRFTINESSVSQLFDNDKHVVYFVPRYQREFTWKKTEWQKLFDDINENALEYFLGSIILIDQSRSSDEARRMELVDGQQRIVTLSLLCAAIYSNLVLCKDKGSLNDDQSAEMINLKWRLILNKSLKNITDQIRLFPQDFSLERNSDLKAYKAVLADAGLIKASTKLSDADESLIIKSYQYFKDRLNDLTKSESEGKNAIMTLLEKVNNAKLVEIDVASHSEAYTLFESLNNRGIDLSGVDIIKSKLLARLDELGRGNIDHYSNKWEELLSCLGNDYTVQERFFRQYYNAFRKVVPGVKNPVATRSNLVQIYEEVIQDAEDFLDKIMIAGDFYSFIICRSENKNYPKLKENLLDLQHIEGAPSYLLLLYLLANKDLLSLNEDHLREIVDQLVSFFVRRNLTDFPSTNKLARLFMGIVEEKLVGLKGEDIVRKIYHELSLASSNDETFQKSLEGPVYSENADVVRFILCSLEEKASGNEKWDLWRMYNKHYVWTIEHIFPQGRNIPKSWVEMIAGGDEGKAKELQKMYVHHLGNLTITGYNSNLGTKSFKEKKDRKDPKGFKDSQGFAGYRNGLHLNEYIVNCEEWNVDKIEERTKKLVTETLKLFPLKDNPGI